MTVQRLGRLVAAGDAEGVRAAVTAGPALLARTVERDGQAGWTPLHLAVAENRPEAVRVLIEAGADLSARTGHFRTPLNLALEHAPELVAQLRAAGAPVDPPSAAYLDEVEQLARQLDDGARLSDPRTGIDLLEWAARGGAVGTARLLLERGADADGGALHAAAGRASLDLVRLLLAAGADVDRRDPETGRAPLHEAVAAGPGGDADEVVRLLIEAGADVDATTDDGASALDISRVAAARSRRADAGRATGNDALADLLVAHGASG
jgi:ankyrin repeat protein